MQQAPPVLGIPWWKLKLVMPHAVSRIPGAQLSYCRPAIEAYRSIEDVVHRRSTDLSTWPDEFSLSTSFDLEEIKEWETSAIVVQAMHTLATTRIREIEVLILHEMHLQRGDVSVSTL